MNERPIGMGGYVALAAAIAIVVVAVFSHWGYVVVMWPVALAGLLGLGITLWRYRQWPLLITAPVLLASLGTALMLLYECSNGNCL